MNDAAESPAGNSDVMLDKQEMARLFRVSTRTIDRWDRELPGFPRPVLIGKGRRKRWDSAVVRKYLRLQKTRCTGGLCVFLDVSVMTCRRLYGTAGIQTDRRAAQHRARGKQVSRCYQKYRLADDAKRYEAPASHDRQESRTRARDFVEQHIRQRLGLVKHEHAAQLVTIREHLDAYERSMKADNLDPRWVRMKIGALRRMCKDCGFKLATHIRTSKVKDWLLKQREAGVHTLRSSNHHIAYIRAFSHWLAEEERLPADPLVSLKKYRGDIPRKRMRRPLKPEARCQN